MSTVVMSKKRFLHYLDGQISDNDVMLVTVDKSGSIKYTKKTNSKSVQFDWAADCFESKDDIRDFLTTIPTFGVAICKKEHLTKDTFDMVKIGDEKYLPKPKTKQSKPTTK